MRSLMNTKDDMALTVIRLLLGVVFFAHGAQKVLGWFGGYGWAGTIGFFGSLGIPAPLGALGILAEFLGGISLILGVLTRVGAAGILVNMLVAVALIHLPNGFFMNWGQAVNGTTAVGEGYEFHLLVIGMSLALIMQGAGAASVDRAMSKG